MSLENRVIHLGTPANLVAITLKTAESQAQQTVYYRGIKYSVGITGAGSAKAKELVGDLMKASTVKEMLAPQTPPLPEGGHAGLGLAVTLDGSMIHFEHAGHNEGYRSHMVGFDKEGKAVVVMANGENGDGLISEIFASVANAYQFPPSLKPQPVAVLPIDAKVKECLGDYRVMGTEPLETIKIEFREDKLYVTVPDLPFRTRLYPLGPDKLKIFENGEELTLVPAASPACGPIIPIS